MRVLDDSPLPYVPSWATRSDHLRKRMVVYRKKIEEERKQQENQRPQRPEEWL